MAGEPKYDQDNIALIASNRGTNDVEAWHRVLIRSFAGFRAGVRLTNGLLVEKMLRYTHRMSQRRRVDFLKMGHYDTWLVDKTQLAHESLYGNVLYPNWSNSCVAPARVVQRSC